MDSVEILDIVHAMDTLDEVKVDSMTMSTLSMDSLNIVHRSYTMHCHICI